MAARFWGGIAGWLAAVLPLLAVNALDYFGIYYFPDPVIAGLLALVGGLLLGGIVAALLGKRRGGVPGAATSGALAAILYAASLIGLLYASRASDALPSLITQHPLRVSAAILFFAALLLLVSLVTAVLTAGRAAEATPAALDARRGPASTSSTSSTSGRRPPTSYPAHPVYPGAPAVTSRPLYGPPSGTQGRLPGVPQSPSAPSTARDGATRPRVYAPPPPPRSAPYYGQPPEPSRPLRDAPQSAPVPRYERNDQRSR